MTNRQLQLLKKKYLREGYKMGLKQAALNEGWSYRRGYNAKWQDMAPNRFSKAEWAIIKQSFTDAADEAMEELGDDDPATIADHWQQTFPDLLIDQGISPRRLRNGAQEIANYFVQTQSEIGVMDKRARTAGDIIYDALTQL